MSKILIIFMVMVIPVLIFYITITLFNLVDKRDLFGSKKEMRYCIMKQILILMVLSVILALILNVFNISILSTSIFVVTLLFMFYISIKKTKNVRLYEKYGYDSKIEFLYEILFIGLQLTLAICLEKIVTKANCKLQIIYYCVNIFVYIVFKIIFLICGKKFSKKECLKNIAIFVFSFIFSTIAFSTMGFQDLIKNSLPLWIVYFSLVEAEALFCCFANNVKVKQTIHTIRQRWKGASIR